MRLLGSLTDVGCLFLSLVIVAGITTLVALITTVAIFSETQVIRHVRRKVEQQKRKVYGIWNSGGPEDKELKISSTNVGGFDERQRAVQLMQYKPKLVEENKHDKSDEAKHHELDNLDGKRIQNKNLKLHA